MRHIFRGKLGSIFLLGCAAYVVSYDVFAASRMARSSESQLDHLIPREKWAGAGLDKLTTEEQQNLAGEITALLGSGVSAPERAPMPAAKDRSQWRSLKRHMSKDEVRKRLGKPERISTSRFYESWEYLGGSVTFDNKGRVDFWSEP